jgi:hypothetical protein
MVVNRIAQLVKPYFDWLEDLFGHLATEANQNQVSAGDISRHYLGNSQRRKNFDEDAMPVIRQYVTDFWKKNENFINTEIKSLPGLKAHFGGDLGPQFHDHLFERIGLYFETVVVPDPLLRVFMIPSPGDKNRDYYVLKYAISLLQFKEIYLADVFPPLAVLVSDPGLNKPGAIPEKIGKAVSFDCISVTNKLYETKFETFDELRSFFSKFNSTKEAAKNIIRPEFFWLSEAAPIEPLSQLEAHESVLNKSFSIERLPEEWQGGQKILFFLLGRMYQVNEVLHQASVQNAHPLIQAPVSFHWLKLKTEINQELISKELEIDINVELLKTNALLSKNLDWLSNIPINTLVEFRRKGRLEEFRKLVSKDFNQLSDLSLQDVSRVTNQVDYNLSTAFAEHQEKLSELNMNLKQEMIVSVPTLLLSIAAILQPIFATTLPAWLSPIGGIVGATKLKDVIAAATKYYRERNTIDKTPVGILWEVKKHAKEQ